MDPRGYETVEGMVEGLKEEVLSWCGREFICPDCGKLHRIPTKSFIMGEGVIEGGLPAEVEALVPKGRVTVVADKNTYEAAGRRVEMALRSGWDLDMVVLPEGPNGQVLPDEAALEMVEAVAGRGDIVIAVGSGTINDLTRFAADELGKPYIVVATAPSMNGYSSPISALLIKGIKRTLPAEPPIAIIADIDVLASSPRDMIRSGLADLSSKPVCNADWRISSLLFQEYWCPLPERMISKADEVVSRLAKEIGEGDKMGVGALTCALVLSGMSMTVAGSSSPASGGEHLVSHFIDTMAHLEGRPLGLHGLQVGVATISMARLYERIIELKAGDIDIGKVEMGYMPLDILEERIGEIYGPLKEEVMAEAVLKYLPWDKKRGQLERLLDMWEEVVEGASKIVRPAEEIEEILKEAGAPTSYRELGLSEDDFAKALRWARYMRRRYTVLDLAYDIGILEDFIRSEVYEGRGGSWDAAK
jgi:glycerol-1-phosphate dehydrogenase [NAD(P)+]